MSYISAAKQRAKELGEITYTGKPCTRGHSGLRYTKSGACVDCQAGRGLTTEERKKKYARTKHWYDKLSPEQKEELLEKQRTRNRNKTQEQKQARNIAAKEQRIRQKRENPKMAWAKMVVYHARLRARKAGVPFNLTVDYVISIAGPTCPILDCELKYDNEQYRSWDSASLDKVKPDKGYIMENVRVISMRANTIKNNATAEELLKVADYVLSHSSVASSGLISTISP